MIKAFGDGADRDQKFSATKGVGHDSFATSQGRPSFEFVRFSWSVISPSCRPCMLVCLDGAFVIRAHAAAAEASAGPRAHPLAASPHLAAAPAERCASKFGQIALGMVGCAANCRDADTYM